MIKCLVTEICPSSPNYLLFAEPFYFLGISGFCLVSSIELTLMIHGLGLGHCTLHIAHCILYISHYKLHTSHFTLNTSHCTQKTAYCTRHTSHCTLHTKQYILHTKHCTLQTAHCHNILHRQHFRFEHFAQEYVHIRHGRLKRETGSLKVRPSLSQ